MEMDVKNSNTAEEIILAPEFYQPLRDLGTYYHDRAAGIGAADAIVDFLEADYLIAHQGNEQIPAQSAVDIQAEFLVALSPQRGFSCTTLTNKGNMAFFRNMEWQRLS